MTTTAATFLILLVEDNSADVYLVRKALEHEGSKFQLILMPDGAEALAFIRREDPYSERPVPDVAVLDLNLPKNEGAEVLETLRKSKDLSNVPVVIMTSTASVAERQRVERFGAERYITKPCDLDEYLQIGSIVRDVILESRAAGRRDPELVNNVDVARS